MSHPAVLVQLATRLLVWLHDQTFRPATKPDISKILGTQNPSAKPSALSANRRFDLVLMNEPYSLNHRAASLAK